MRVLPAAAMVALVAALAPAATAAAKTPPAPEPPAEYPEPPTEFNPAVEAENFSITEQRQEIYDTPEYQRALTEQGNANTLEALSEQAADPERLFTDDLCWNGGNGCAGDVRLYNWEKDNDGIVRRVLFTSRGGATLSGRIWATREGPAKRPGVVITDGSVQADEQMYWYAAQALAKDGYVVMTFDPQGQGRSDTFGASARRRRRLPRPDRRAPLLRRHRGRAELLPLHRQAPLRAGAELRNGHQSRGQAERTRGQGTGRRLRPALEGAEEQARSASPGTPTAPSASPTSPSGTRA